MTLVIRDATPADRDIIADYNSRLSEETDDGPLDSTLIVPGVTALLADRAKGRYWLAEENGQIVGQIGITYEWSDWRNGMLWWVQSVYVHADHRRKGVFSALFRHVESLAEEDSEVVGLRLYVERDNARAQATYTDLGLSMTGFQVMQSLFRDKS